MQTLENKTTVVEWGHLRFFFSPLGAYSYKQSIAEKVLMWKETLSLHSISIMFSYEGMRHPPVFPADILS